MHSLDGLFAGDSLPQRPVLIKCDVEGAELQVLQGAQAFLKQTRAELLLSVHPTFLPHYGSSTEGVGRYLKTAGYQYEEIAVDNGSYIGGVYVDRVKTFQPGKSVNSTRL